MWDASQPRVPSECPSEEEGNMECGAMGQKLNTQNRAGFQEQREAGGSCLGSWENQHGGSFGFLGARTRDSSHDLKPSLPAHPG